MEMNGGTRVVITEDNVSGFSVPCEGCRARRIAKAKEEFQEMSELTCEEKGYRLDDIVTDGRPGTLAVVAACKEMIAGKASMLTFWGECGNAKSIALIAVVNHFLDNGVPAVYLPAYDMLNWIQDAFSSNGHEVKNQSAYERLEMLKGVKVLAVDELQGIKITDWRIEQIRNIVDRRWRDGLDGAKYTLFAMNESPDCLEDRIRSRINDGRNRIDGSPVVQNKDSDMRKLLRRSK